MTESGTTRAVCVKTDSCSYDVRIASNLIKDLGNTIRDLTDAKRCVLVSGEHVFPLYGNEAMESVRNAGLDVSKIVFPAGENTKSLTCYGELQNFLAEKKLTRSDCLVALGGGVTGDLCGFAAATYQRGIACIQVPTTLLAMVDSSVGGKTAINLPAGKNQVGAFWQPRCVLCDTETLHTLPKRELTAGYAEVIKYAIMSDADLFDHLQLHDIGIEEIIETCVKIKAEIVGEDERDTGRRRLLNLGHSFGHAIESRSGYKLLHGEAVAVGLAMISRASVKMGRLDPFSLDAILELLRNYSLPAEPEWPAKELFDLILMDKKIYSGKLHLIVPKAIGWCEIEALNFQELRLWLEAAYD